MVFLEANASSYRWDLAMSWRIDVGGADPTADRIIDPNEQTNKREGIKHVFCGPLATEPECVNATL